MPEEDRSVRMHGSNWQEEFDTRARQRHANSSEDEANNFEGTRYELGKNQEPNA